MPKPKKKKGIAKRKNVSRPRKRKVVKVTALSEHVDTVDDMIDDPEGESMLDEDNFSKLEGPY